MAGQTLPLSYTNWNADITVVAVDSVLIGTAMRARYELGNSWAQYLIEGVGSSHGLFEPLSNFFDCGYTLDCFGLGAEGFYPEDWVGGCELEMGTAQLEEPRVFSIAPNPSHGNVFIAGLRAGSQVTVSDATGRTVLAQRSSTDRLQLDVSALPNGCYVVTSDGRTARLYVAH
ncbi:MAG: T9SS type A sorting domain-containing protein [Flavobacteriales bacterium]|nr:T9SS type A sorting domain-containing protein [Flavobacteriales bacterium]